MSITDQKVISDACRTQFRDTIHIGFVGYKDSGKTTIAKAYQQEFGGTFVNFATPLYAMVANGFRIPMEVVMDKEARNVPRPELGGQTIRYALDTLGTPWGRETMWKDIWVYNEFERLRDTKGKDAKYFLYENIRHYNEIKEPIETFGRDKFVLVYVDNPNIEGDDSSIGDQHIRELRKLCDFDLYNEIGMNTPLGQAIYIRSMYEKIRSKYS